MEQMLSLFNVFLTRASLSSHLSYRVYQTVPKSTMIQLNYFIVLWKYCCEVHVTPYTAPKLAAIYSKIKNQVIVGMTGLFVDPCDMVLNVLFPNSKILIQFIQLVLLLTYLLQRGSLSYFFVFTNIERNCIELFV